MFEFLYSYRDTKDSEFPSFTSKTAIDALMKISEVKSKVSSGKRFSFFLNKN